MTAPARSAPRAPIPVAFQGGGRQHRAHSRCTLPTCVFFSDDGERRKADFAVRGRRRARARRLFRSGVALSTVDCEASVKAASSIKTPRAPLIGKRHTTWFIRVCGCPDGFSRAPCPPGGLPPAAIFRIALTLSLLAFGLKPEWQCHFQARSLFKVPPFRPFKQLAAAKWAFGRGTLQPDAALPSR